LIPSLRKEKRLHLHKVAGKTKELDKQGKGNHFNTIRSHEELCEYYKDKIKNYKKKQKDIERHFFYCENEKYSSVILFYQRKYNV
jgi:hypothetical protein